MSVGGKERKEGEGGVEGVTKEERENDQNLRYFLYLQKKRELRMQDSMVES